MSGSSQFPMTSKDFNPETIERAMKEEMLSEEDDSGEEFTHGSETETKLIVDDIEIKDEDMDYLSRHNTSVEVHSEDHSDLSNETTSMNAHVESGSTEAEEKDLKDFYQDLLKCARDCETCVKYMKMLREHVRASHVPLQQEPMQEVLLIDTVPAPLTGQSYYTIQIKSEMDENNVKMDSSDSEEVRDDNSDFDPDCNIESESDSDPDYGPKLRRQGNPSAKTPASNRSRRLRSKKEVLLSHEHLKCGECDKSFKSMIGLEEHMRIHQRPVKRDVSEKRSTRSSNLAVTAVHKRFRTGEGEFICDVCKRSFSKQGALTNHMSIHTRGSPFECDVCEMKFRFSSQFNKHQRVHTGEKPFKCDVCGKGFTNCGNLTKHKRLHTGVKPFKCDVCLKAFTSSSHLVEHKRIHTGDKPFKCHACGKCFSKSNNLTVHMRIHTGEKPFKCEVCVKSFSKKIQLIAHKRNHTGERHSHSNNHFNANSNSADVPSNSKSSTAAQAAGSTVGASGSHVNADIISEHEDTMEKKKKKNKKTAPKK